MGGTGFSLKLARIEGASGSAAELYAAVYSIVEANIERLARGPGYEQVTADYLSIARGDGEGEGTTLQFGFKDGGGTCCMSMDACCHWFQLLIAALAKADRKGASVLDDVARQHGFRVTQGPGPLAALLDECDAPLIELRKNLFSTGTHRGKVFLTSDDLDEETLAIEDLTPKERAKVEALVKKKRCGCRICLALRKSPKLRVPKSKSKPEAARMRASRVKTTLHGKHRNIEIETQGEFPLELLAPADLESIEIQGPIDSLPAELETLRRLTRVTISRTNIERLPDVLTRMTWLEQLDILHACRFSLRDLARLPWLKKLRVRDIRGVGADFEEFPFEALRGLSELHVEECELVEIPAQIGELTELRELTFGSNPLTELPDSLRGLKRLERLEIWNTNIRSLPKAIGELFALTNLCADSSKLETVPEGSLPSSLEHLSLEFCHELRSLPESIAKLTRLEALRCAGAKLERLPKGVQKLENLKSLRLDDNELLELPAWIGELPQLEWLGLQAVPMTALPDSIQKLKKLQCLRLGRTRVFPLPDWITGLRKLEELEINGAVLPRGEKARLKRLLPKTKIRD